MADDPDRLTAEQRRDAMLRLAAVQGQHQRERRIANMTPLEVAEADLAATVDFVREYRAGRTAFPVNETNDSAAEALVQQLRDQVDRIRGE